MGWLLLVLAAVFTYLACDAYRLRSITNLTPAELDQILDPARINRALTPVFRSAEYRALTPIIS
jgi:hypothetical protein